MIWSSGGVGEQVEEPGNCAATYNLCGIWIERDCKKGERRAIPRLEQLHVEHPGYMFAAIALGQIAAKEDDFVRARQLLARCYHAPRLYTSEAVSLFAAETQICLAENNIDAAERAYDSLHDIACEDDDLLVALRNRIDRASRKKGLRKLLSRLIIGKSRTRGEGRRFPRGDGNARGARIVLPRAIMSRPLRGSDDAGCNLSTMSNRSGA